MEDVNESVIAVKIPGGAHCSDLRGTTISNFPGVAQAHKIEKEHIFMDHERKKSNTIKCTTKTKIINISFVIHHPFQNDSTLSRDHFS